ncbi:MAG: hypothetical protein AB1Z65_00675, partial [Candidatus Sulfomarinibacteraceae bacterium]
MKIRALCCAAVLSVTICAFGQRPVPTDPVAGITEAALADDFAWGWLSTLCDVYGPRLTGSS